MTPILHLQAILHQQASMPGRTETGELAHLGAGVGVRKTQLTPGHVMLLQALQEPGDVQAQAAHNLAHKLVADTWNVGGLLNLRAQL